MSLPEDIAALAVQMQKVVNRHDLRTLKFNYYDAEPNDQLKIEVATRFGDLDLKGAGSSPESVRLEDEPFEQIRSLLSAAVRRLKKNFEIKVKSQVEFIAQASAKQARALECLAKVTLLDPPVLDKLVQALDDDEL